MTKDQFEHTVRAAGAILGEKKILVIGSQAIHASIDYSIPEAERSIETDICSFNDGDGTLADLIDGSIGELSMFQDTFGYYAQGVTIKTAVLPGGWRKRLVPYKTPNTGGITAYCLELNDLWISKAIAGRPKDFEFCKSLINQNLVKASTLQSRLKKVPDVNPVIRKKVAQLIPKLAT
ncbi:MAG: hypothetical protein ACI909_003200 [Planctomycetota bacterium]|jgi:hypothetical protein